jgi:hypothetical protein
MSEKTKNQSVWCDNGHEPIQMIYSHDTILENGSIYICSLCHAEKIVKESVWNNKISIEWKSKPVHSSLPPRNTR